MDDVERGATRRSIPGSGPSSPLDPVVCTAAWKAKSTRCSDNDADAMLDQDRRPGRARASAQAEVDGAVTGGKHACGRGEIPQTGVNDAAAVAHGISTGAATDNDAADVDAATASASRTVGDGGAGALPNADVATTHTSAGGVTGAAVESGNEPSGAPMPVPSGDGSGGPQEEELSEEVLLLPSQLVREEQRLREERDQRQQDEEADQAASAPKALTTTRFTQLDELLNRAGMYTRFLKEQMASIQAPTMPQASQPAARGGGRGGARGGKRGRGAGAGGRAAKRRKQDDGDAGEAGGAPSCSGVGLPAAPPGAATTQQELLPLMEGELRDYQLKGVRWMISLWQNGLNGILADQMGLGKTVQTIGLLSHLRANGIKGPFLIVGPLSTLPNWVSEVKRWCPSMPVLLYHGSKVERAELRAKHLPVPVGSAGVGPDFPVICTSYEIVMADIKPLGLYKYQYVIIDEGHRLKNFNCRLLRELRSLNAANKLLLTGTPLQNNLTELWSLLNFLLPDIFTSLADFDDWFDQGGISRAVTEAAASGGNSEAELVAAQQREKVVSKLHTMLKPFLLRRIKADVEIALPRKQEVLLYAPMVAKQREINQQLLERTLADEMAKVAEAEGLPASSAGTLNNVLMQMRKNCNHPDLITSAFTQELDYPTPDVLVSESGKMALLDRLLKRLKAKGHKVLIFSQMTKMLDLLESYLEQLGERACRIDGSVPWQQRQQNISDFNADPKVWLFLLSTRAGGLGINLTGADTVIIYDSDWNPHQDLQAMDRCHRIGQTRPVMVFRLATAHSVEGRMLQRAAGKMALERLVIKKGVFKEVVDAAGGADHKRSDLSAAELLELLRTDISADDVPQSAAVADDTLDALLDRSHLQQEGAPLPYPPAGVGYQVVASDSSSALLSGVE